MFIIYHHTIPYGHYLEIIGQYLEEWTQLTIFMMYEVVRVSDLRLQLLYYIVAVCSTPLSQCSSFLELHGRLMTETTTGQGYQQMISKVITLCVSPFVALIQSTEKIILHQYTVIQYISTFVAFLCAILLSASQFERWAWWTGQHCTGSSAVLIWSYSRIRSGKIGYAQNRNVNSQIKQSARSDSSEWPQRKQLFTR